MRLTHNPSFLRQAGIMIVVLAAIVAAAYVLDGARCALWAAGAGLATGVLFALFSALRSRQVMRLASEVDEVLHEGRRIDFSDYREGDLAILKNQLSKMVATLRDATMRLEKEKGALADALADVSHQIRTPLTAMSLMVPAIEKSADDAERTRTLRELERMIDRVGWLVSTLLKVAKVDAGAFRVQKVHVDAARMAHDALSPLAAALDLHDIVCTIDASEGASFTGDAAWSAEALENVLKNCMEHTPAGGSIRVEVREDALACRIRVTDTGPGIAPEDLPHVFERFYRRGQEERAERDAARDPGQGAGPREQGTEPQGRDAGGEHACTAQQGRAAARAAQGFGIGLALAQSLVSAQGGTLRASNAPEGGARFDMTFPKMNV